MICPYCRYSATDVWMKVAAPPLFAQARAADLVVAKKASTGWTPIDREFPETPTYSSGDGDVSTT